MDGVIDVIARLTRAHTTVLLEPDKINDLLGTDISEEAMMRDPPAAWASPVDGDAIIVPSWRADVEHYSDIAEEVARFYGYNNIPCHPDARPDHPAAATPPTQKCERSWPAHLPQPGLQTRS